MRRTTKAATGLAAYRAARGGTMEAEAKLSGVARQTWHRWEHGLTRPLAHELQAVADRWGVTVEALQEAPACSEAIAPVRALVERLGSGPVRAALVVVSGPDDQG